VVLGLVRLKTDRLRVIWPGIDEPGYDGQMQVNILDAKNRLSQLVKVAQGGEEVVIANRGRPVARLTAASPASATLSAAVELPGDVVAWLDRHALPAHARRSAAEIDDALARERAAWD
jgi:prevent-host-death family protein